MLYGTAGIASERSDRIEDFSAGSVTRRPRDQVGWVAGFGTEARLDNTGWIGRVEYLHYDFGSLELLRSADNP